MRRCPAGFTLIELLVVISIIALLAAILFPVFSRARAKALSGSCQSNLHQIGLSIRMYTTDNDGDILPGKEGSSTWPILIFPYTRNVQIYVCPAKPDTGIGYGYNYYNLGFDHITYHEAEIVSESETIACVDAGRVTNPTAAPDDWEEDFDDGTLVSMPNDPAYNVAYPCRPTARHLEGCNVAFLDGHVKWLKMGVIVGPREGDRNCLYDRQ